jgi:hypothetical protein
METAMDNVCKYNGTFWECTLGDWFHQEKMCSESLKSRNFERCMYYCEDGRCDNIYAQDSKTICIKNEE